MPADPRRALDAPAGPVIPVGPALIARVVAASRASDRRRMILPLHQDAEDRLHRMLNALQPDTYVRPHRHEDPRAESLIVLRGALRLVTFASDGTVDLVLDLAPDGDLGVDIAGGVYHTLVALAPDTVVFEVKPGPYRPTADKDFAAWAPAEGTATAATYLASLRALTPGV